MVALEVEDLHVRYGDVHAVRGVSFEVAEGEVFGLLGPNGAGKTSVLEVCEGYRPAADGAVRVLGSPAGAKALRPRVGVVLQEVAVTPFLTVREVLTRNAAYYPKPRDVEEAIGLVGLQEKASARVNTLSGGQQRRLDLALGVIGRPELLFLDEPTTGFDPSARRDAWEVVRALREQGTTVVLTTHYLDEAEALADRVCVVSAGEVVAQGPPRSLAGRDNAVATIRFADPGCPVPEAGPGPHGMQIQTDDAVRSLHRLTGWAIEHDVTLSGLVVERPSLEDVYLQLVAP